MTNWRETTRESRLRWDQNAHYWDEKMGEHSNRFHREIIRPATEELLSLSPGENVLDVACGNGNFSRRLAEMGAKVTAFDYSANMIEAARKRCADYKEQIDFHVVDATNIDELMGLQRVISFDKAVANMALMDISDIHPLLEGLSSLLKMGGCFVFSLSHPSFQTPGRRSVVETEDIGTSLKTRHGVVTFQYNTPSAYEGLAITGQPVPHLYYHRSLSLLFSMCFEAGFVIDGLAEPTFEQGASTGEWIEIPPALVVRLRKV